MAASFSHFGFRISDFGFKARRRGLTLLELILALSLSVVLLFAVGLALRLYWRAFDVKRTNVEQSHLARAILQHIDRDLHSAVQSTPVDLSGLESMTSSTSLAGAFAGMTGAGSPAAAAGASTGGSGGAGSSTGGTTGSAGGTSTQTPSSQGSGSASTGAATSSSTTTGTSSGATSGSATSTGGTSTAGQSASGEATEEATAAGTPASVVGLYGSANQLQFDVSRLPRVDEYAGGSPTSMVQIPSDIKTLTYYVRGDSGGGDGSAAGSSEPSTTGQGRGLMRLEMDRAVSAYSESNGALSANYDNAKLLADEVTSITFRYWNGTQWATDWNSDEMGGLPLAIEVVMTMADPNAAVSTDTAVQNLATTDETSTDASYRIVVNLPTASLPPPAEEPATEGDTAAAGTGTTGSGEPASSSTKTGGSSGS